MNKFKSFLWACCALLALTSSTNHKPTIYIIGDSTAADKPKYATSPERGWGMMLRGCFSEDVEISNHAVNGRSSKSFIDEGRWRKVLEQLRPGDYVLIQFGHNDEKPQPERHTEPGSTFDANLRRFVTETKAKGAHPVLLNAVVRRNFHKASKQNDDDEKLRDSKFSGEDIVNSDTLIDTHGAYLVSPRKVAKEEGVPFIDANTITKQIEEKLGPEGSRELHMWYKPGEIPTMPEGRQDNTHYNIYGARVVANAMADAIGKAVPALQPYVRHYDYVVSTEGRGDFMTLQEAIDAAPSGKPVTILVLGGTWSRPTIPQGKQEELVRYFNAKIG